MRFILILALTAIFSLIGIFIMPWWIPMPIAFLLILWKPMPLGKSILATGFGAAICFLVLASIKDIENQQILSSRIANLFHLPSSFLLILIFGIIAFITAGFGGWTAIVLNSAIKHRKSLKHKKY